jgi:DNA-binding PadR family transcriptional regulator
VPAKGPSKPLPVTDPRKLRAALEGQDERERRVLELRYGLGGERQHSLSEVGRLLGLSGERIRQIEARALDRLDRHERGLPLTPAPRARPSRRRMARDGASSSRRRFLRPWTLALLRLRATHGSELKERLRELGMPEADYRFLRALEEEGLLRSTWVPGAGVGPDRRVYSLTPQGESELDQNEEALRKIARMLEALFDRPPQAPPA